MTTPNYCSRHQVVHKTLKPYASCSEPKKRVHRHKYDLYREHKGVLDLPPIPYGPFCKCGKRKPS